MVVIPQKLEKDAIVEALFDIRFVCNQDADFPERTIGKLLDGPLWSGFEARRYPISDIPHHVRIQEAELKFQPIMELTNIDRTQLVKIGTNVISYHIMEPYIGWSDFEKRLNKVADFVFNALQQIDVVRLGFRYINLMTEVDHQINNISDLNYTFAVNDQIVNEPQLVTFKKKHGDEHMSNVKISSPEFVNSNVPKEFSALIDVDVYTPNSFSACSLESVILWINKAHDIEKEEFFRLLTSETIDQLKAK